MCKKCLLVAILHLAMSTIFNLKPVNNIFLDQMCLLYVIMPVSIDYFKQPMILMLI